MRSARTAITSSALEKENHDTASAMLASLMEEEIPQAERACITLKVSFLVEKDLSRVVVASRESVEPEGPTKTFEGQGKGSTRV